MDNPKSVWIWTNPHSKSKTFWISMNINNEQGALAVTNAPLFTLYAPLVFSYFSTKASKVY